MPNDEQKSFTEFKDYYLEDGRIHFTKEYLENKGQCCGANCRHCPYTEHIKGNTTLREDSF